MANLSKKRIQKFTIVEILVAMSVFTIMMLIIMQIFGSLQNVWNVTSKQTQTAQNANMIMNMISADLQSAYYSSDALDWESWCYYQKNTNITNVDTPIWFVTSRQKSVQASNSSQVQCGYWVEPVTKDGVSLFALKNLTISNIPYDDVSADLYNFKKSGTPHNDLKNIPSSLSKIATVVDDNIISLKVTPYVKIINSGSIDWNDSGNCRRLPAHVKIELKMLDDDPSVRAAYSKADSEEKNTMIKTYTRIIELNRGQYYNN